MPEGRGLPAEIPQNYTETPEQQLEQGDTLKTDSMVRHT